MKLISMTDFVICCKENSPIEEFNKVNETFVNRVISYAEFLKQPLTLGMFVPCDDDGNILTEPKLTDYTKSELEDSDMGVDIVNYNEAKERVLFKDVTVTAIEDYFIVKIGKREVWITWTERTIEDVQHINRAYEVDFELTYSAVKQLGL